MDRSKSYFLRDSWMIERLQKGDYKFFEGLFNQYYEPLYKYGCQFDIIKDHVHDCIQDLFIDLWNNKERIEINYSLQAYLFKSLRYKIQSYVRKEKVSSTNLSRFFNETFEIIFDEEEYLKNYKIEQKELEKLKNCIINLAPKQRELIYLIFYNGLSYDEASNILDINKKTAYNQVRSAVKNLKAAMGSASLIYFIMSVDFS